MLYKVYRKVILLYVCVCVYVYVYIYIYIYTHIYHTYIFLFRFFSIIGYYQMLNTVPCATQ